MSFNASLLKVLNYQPWRWQTPPTTNPDGSYVPGVIAQTLDGVFIMVDEDLVTWMKNNLTQAQKDEIDQWANRYNLSQLVTWNAPCWAGQNSAVYIRVPASVWSDPTTAPPQKVKDYFKSLWS